MDNVLAGLVMYIGAHAPVLHIDKFEATFACAVRSHSPPSVQLPNQRVLVAFLLSLLQTASLNTMSCLAGAG